MKDPLSMHCIMLGDEFQSMIYDVMNAPRYTVIYRVAIKAMGKKFDSRISFSIASNAETKEFISESMGEVFF